MSESALHSSIYTGWVRHRRAAPKHAFRYPVFMAYLDLSELEEVFAKSPFWSLERLNFATFRRADYLGEGPDLREDVRDKIREKGIDVPNGAIRILTHLRYFGHCFNPVSFYFCFNEAEELEVIVSEITNTPWDERFCYVHDVRESKRKGKLLQFSFSKQFHVSPFLDMDYQYDWKFSCPDKNILIHMKNYKNSEVEFDATLSMQRRHMTSREMRTILFEYPVMTLKVVWGIYWQAFVLWMKKAKFFDHPETQIDKEHQHAGES